MESRKTKLVRAIRALWVCFIIGFGIIAARLVADANYNSATGHYCYECGKAAECSTSYTDGSTLWYCARHPPPFMVTGGGGGQRGSGNPWIVLMSQALFFGLWGWIVSKITLSGPDGSFAYVCCPIVAVFWPLFWSASFFKGVLLIAALLTFMLGLKLWVRRLP